MANCDASQIQTFESCPRKFFWKQSWEPRRLSPIDAVRRAISTALLDTERTDRGELAGETVMEIAADRGLLRPYKSDWAAYDAATHAACLADILTTYLAGVTECPWQRPEALPGWSPLCFLERSGLRLARIVLADYWDDDRAASEAHSWYSIGEIAQYRLPMTLYVLAVGPNRKGKRHSYWTKGLLHPMNRTLRFAKRGSNSGGKKTAFSESWRVCWRENHDQISREKWLDAMRLDGVIEECAIKVNLDVPGELQVQRVLDVIARKREAMSRASTDATLPDPNYSACSFPRPCGYFDCCLGSGEAPSLDCFVQVRPEVLSE